MSRPPIPTALPEFVLKAAREHTALHPPVRREKKTTVPREPSRPKGTVGLIITLPSWTANMMAIPPLPPLKVYACECPTTITAVHRCQLREGV